MKAGWQIKSLGELCEVFADGDWVESKDQSPDGIRLIQTGNVGQGVFKDRGEKARYISNATFQRLRCTEIFEGDCLISRLPDPAGRSCILPDTGERMITAVDCTIVRFKRNYLIPEFFNYYSQSCDYLQGVDYETTGTTRKRISRSKLGEVSIPVPPLPEQQRIVLILDDIFEGIATAKANTEKNLQNARALFESQLNDVFTQRGEGWVEKPLSGFAQSVSTGPFGSLLHKSDYVSDGVPLVNPINIVNGSIVPDANKMIDPATKQRLQSYVLQQGDIVVGRRGEIGRCAVVEAEQAGWMCGTGCFFIRPLQSVNPYFLANLIRSSNYREQLERASSGATMLNLSNKALGELPVAIPNLLVQNHMLAQLEILSDETQRLESIYQQKLAALESLKKSMLDQAFSGEI